MRDLPAVDQWIRDVLSGSELPLDRRAEIADEWYDHLHEHVAAECATGATPETAVQAALAAFGDPARLRRQLRHGQRARDLREALAKTRSLAAWTVAAALCAAAGMAVFLVDPASAAHRLAGGCVFFVAVVLVALVPAFVANLVELRVTRSRPIDEFHLVRSFILWTVVVAAFLGGTLLLAPAAVGLVGYFARDGAFLSMLCLKPEIMPGAPGLFWRNFAVAVCEFPVRSFVIPPIMILVGAVAITFYERSRCVDMTTEEADH